MGRTGSCTSSSAPPWQDQTSNHLQFVKYVQPEERIGVEIAGAHHDHVHLSSAAILESKVEVEK